MGASTIDDDAVTTAVQHVDLARRALEAGGEEATPSAQRHLEAAIVGLRPTAADGDLPRAEREAAERGRSELSSYVLAALDLAAAGVPAAAVARFLRRAPSF